MNSHCWVVVVVEQTDLGTPVAVAAETAAAVAEVETVAALLAAGTVVVVAAAAAETVESPVAVGRMGRVVEQHAAPVAAQTKVRAVRFACAGGGAGLGVA